MDKACPGRLPPGCICSDAASRPSLDQTQARSPDEGRLESRHCRQGSRPGLVGGCTPTRVMRLLGQKAQHPGDSPLPGCFRGPTEENEEIPVSSGSFWPPGSEDKATWGRFCFCSHLQLMGGHISKHHSFYHLDRDRVLGPNTCSCGEMTPDPKRLLSAILQTLHFNPGSQRVRQQGLCLPFSEKATEAREDEERPTLGQAGRARVWTSSLPRTHRDVNPHAAAGPAAGHHPGLLLLPSLTPAPASISFAVLWIAQSRDLFRFKFKREGILEPPLLASAHFHFRSGRAPGDPRPSLLAGRLLCQ